MDFGIYYCFILFELSSELFLPGIVFSSVCTCIKCVVFVLHLMFYLLSYHCYKSKNSNTIFLQILLPALKKSEPDMKVVNEHKKELGRVERDFKNYFLGSKPFIASDHITIADLLAACEFEQPIAGGYSMSQPIQDFIERVKSQIGPDYDELHSTMRDFAAKASR